MKKNPPARKWASRCKYKIKSTGGQNQTTRGINPNLTITKQKAEVKIKVKQKPDQHTVTRDVKNISTAS